jgi:hypothetical protein
MYVRIENLRERCGKSPGDVSSLQPSNKALQTPFELEELPLICLTGSGGVRSILIPFDVTPVESPTILLTLTVM